jgi:hypothetical protein
MTRFNFRPSNKCNENYWMYDTLPSINYKEKRIMYPVSANPLHTRDVQTRMVLYCDSIIEPLRWVPVTCGITLPFLFLKYCAYIDSVSDSFWYIVKCTYIHSHIDTPMRITLLRTLQDFHGFKKPELLRYKREQYIKSLYITLEVILDHRKLIIHYCERESYFYVFLTVWPPKGVSRFVLVHTNWRSI